MLGCGSLATAPLAVPYGKPSMGVTIPIAITISGALTLPLAQDAWTDVADIEITTVFEMVEIEARST